MSVVFTSVDSNDSIDDKVIFGVTSEAAKAMYDGMIDLMLTGNGCFLGIVDAFPDFTVMK